MARKKRIYTWRKTFAIKYYSTSKQCVPTTSSHQAGPNEPLYQRSAKGCGMT